MCSALRHRGPDEFGLYRDRIAGLAHARLSIIDLATGQQPTCNEDGSVWIAFNGEIYNYLELRGELIQRGHRFHSSSDTEVIVHAYEEWGGHAVERFNGQFAFAIWNRKRRRLFLARDRLGIRPLYHAVHDGCIWFGSEVKALFAGSSLPRELDPRGLDQVFTFWTTVAPLTPFAGIRELRPGHTLTVNADLGPRGAMLEHGYWQPDFSAQQDAREVDPREAAEELMGRLRRATRLRMLRSDVPVGSYLSGGLDSSFVATLGRPFCSDGFRTFSVEFADSGYDERSFQRRMVEHLGSEHSSITCTGRQIAEAFPRVIRHTERPVLRTAPAPLYLLSGLARDHGFKVVLTGEGADELLAGYDLFREDKVRRFWARDRESTLRPRLLERLYPWLARSPTASRAMAAKFFSQGLDEVDRPGFSHRPRWRSAAALKRLFSGGLRDRLDGFEPEAELLATLPREFSSWSPLSQAQYLEIRTLLPGYLLSSQGDRMLMAHSVEGRFPFLDPDVVEFSNGLPHEVKLRVLDEKHVLKLAARDLLPPSILKRPKQPYRAPDVLSFVGEPRPEYADALLDEKLLRRAGVFDPVSAAGLWAKCRARASRGSFSNADNMALVGVLSTQLLWHEFVHAPSTVEPLERNRLSTWVDLAV